MVCSFHHAAKFSPSLSRVTVTKDDRYGLDYPVMCRQCATCPPMETCPVQAITRTASGVTHADHDACIGCGRCVEECTYGAVKLTAGKPLICDLCGGDPECVKRCPTGALTFAESPEFTETPDEAFRMLKERWAMDE